jgi:hypothetical protein
MLFGHYLFFLGIAGGVLSGNGATSLNYTDFPSADMLGH